MSEISLRDTEVCIMIPKINKIKALLAFFTILPFDL
ncbi:MAG: hypothetical protein ACJA2M_000140 [Polaribacter sp.]|jgi:hypothetical protein